MLTNNVVSIETRAPVEPDEPHRPLRRVVAAIRIGVEAFGWFILFGLCVAAVS